MSPETGAAASMLRLLGLVFAGADLVLEVDAEGRIVFALGAAEALTGRDQAALDGTAWTALVGEADAELLSLLLQNVGPGERLGPLRVSLAPREGAATRHASVSVFRLAERLDRLSCAFSLGGHESGDTGRTAEGLVRPERFADTAATLLAQAELAGAEVRLDLVELAGFQAAVADLDEDAAAALRRRVAATLRADSYAGVGAAEVAPDRFALVRPAEGSLERLVERLQCSTGEILSPVIEGLPLEAGAAALNAKAVRYALDRFIEDGPKAATQGFLATVKRMVHDTARFRSALSDGAFKLVYQPVVSLADEQLHHFEALARFDGNASPAETIRLAEELDLILDFDLAVVRTVMKALAKEPGVSIAANISAVSLMQPRFFAELVAIGDAAPDHRPRLLLELTETSSLEDLDKGEAAIARLRQAGHPICLDDFGAGAASLDYLRRLSVDYVKIDGRFVKDVVEGGREAAVLKHVAGLCQDLGAPTIAEMVETHASARLAESLGVTFGQGWAFGKPTAEPRYDAPAPVKRAAKRAGAVEQWG